MKLHYSALIVFIFFVGLQMKASADLHPHSVIVAVDAKNSAQRHNNIGNEYFKTGDYFAAIKEYRIAIAINPNSQTSAAYYNNLGKVYLALGEIQIKYKLPVNEGENFTKMAQAAFENAVSLDCMKLEYYENLVNSFTMLGIAAEKKAYYLNNRDKNPFNVIPAALILEKEGKTGYATALLDDFTSENPDIIITDDLKKLMKRNSKDANLLFENL